MTRARTRATSRDVRHVPREQVTEARPIAKECKVAAAQAEAARGAAGLAAARRIRRVLQEAVGHVGCGACAVAPLCRVWRVGARPCRGEVDGDLLPALLHRIGGARVLWGTVHPRSGPIARADVDAAAAAGATRVRANSWLERGCSHLRADDGRSRRAAGWTARVVGEDADGHLNRLRRGEAEKAREQGEQHPSADPCGSLCSWCCIRRAVPFLVKRSLFLLPGTCTRYCV